MGINEAGAMQRCIDQCRDCEKICGEAEPQIDSVVEDSAARDELRAAILDCAAMCRLCADVMTRRSDLANRVAELCAEFCHRCAEACEEYPEEGVIKSCATTCRLCSEICKEFAIAGASA